MIKGNKLLKIWSNSILALKKHLRKLTKYLIIFNFGDREIEK